MPYQYQTYINLVAVNIRYDPNPTQENLIRAISISRQWSIQNLYDYALDHFKRQFKSGQIHPAVVLGVAREYGIADLIGPAVKALAKPEMPFSSWSTDEAIICHTTVKEVGVIGRMKEKLIMARVALCTPPPLIHDDVTCRPKNRTVCSTSWKGFWASAIVPRLLNNNGDIENCLWWIRTDFVGKARIQGMMDACAERTIEGAVGKPGWRSETKIPDGAVEQLMVPERGMLEPQDIPDVIMA